MRTVAVTGVSGYLGRTLLHALDSTDQVVRVVGIDTAEPAFTSQKLEFYRMDVRSSGLASVISGCDGVVHLASSSAADADEIRDINVGGTRSVTEAMSRTGVRKLVFTSTAAVYGAHPDNDFPLTEDSPVRPLPSSPYATSKAEAESVIRYFDEEHPEVNVTVLRMAWMCGPGLPGSHAKAIESKVRLVIEGYDVPFQALHEEDAANAVVEALNGDLPGNYNVCAGDWVERPEEILGQRRISLDADRARRMIGRASRMQLAAPVDGIAQLMYPQVMSNARLVEAGMRFRHSTSDALSQAADARREWMAVGGLRFRPRRIALVGGTVGAVLLGSAARVRKARRAKA